MAVVMEIILARFSGKSFFCESCIDPVKKRLRQTCLPHPFCVRFPVPTLLHSVLALHFEVMAVLHTFPFLFPKIFLC